MSSGNLVDLRGHRLVLDELADLRPGDHRSRRDREVRPTSNASGSTMAGTRGGADRSETSDRSPRTALRPPVSMTAFQATGLISGLLLGAAASIRLLSTNRIRSLSRQSSSGVGQQRLGRARRRRGRPARPGSAAGCAPTPGRRSGGPGGPGRRPSGRRRCRPSSPARDAPRRGHGRAAGAPAPRRSAAMRAPGTEPAQHAQGRVGQQQVQRARRGLRGVRQARVGLAAGRRRRHRDSWDAASGPERPAAWLLRARWILRLEAPLPDCGPRRARALHLAAEDLAGRALGQLGHRARRGAGTCRRRPVPSRRPAARPGWRWRPA